MNAKLIEKVKNLRLMDDIFFNRFMQDAPECMEYVLNTVIADFHAAEPSKMHSEILAKRVAYLKTNGEEVSTMCNVMEEYVAEKAAEEVRKAEIKNTFNTTLNNIKQLMQNLGLSADKALAALGIDGPERQKYIAAL